MCILHFKQTYKRLPTIKNEIAINTSNFTFVEFVTTHYYTYKFLLKFWLKQDFSENPVKTSEDKSK